jgi:hypothetical protein
MPFCTASSSEGFWLAEWDTNGDSGGVRDQYRRGQGFGNRRRALSNTSSAGISLAIPDSIS